MAKTLPKVKLPKRLIKALGLKPGDRIELVIDEEGNGVVVLSGESAINQAFGIWSDMEEDGVEYVRKLRSQWRKPPEW
ncbi:MAG: AbrB/MazE/SpoVT family DNA-binding domain-containing protein [Armatimonadota bacterium]|nr:AbrB/MazE/SpoVT family DNA-binding domain-containing protein [Armatimonadota bacterium]MDW8026706.1 AbrB/MazE/SpoVT family DNA-binding domain-containing protein [Armatimonadota bacterium]